MKKFVGMLILVMLLVGLVLSSSAVIVEQYVSSPTEIITEQNDTIPQAAPILPQTGGIPMFAFIGTGVLLIVIAVVISGKKSRTAK